MTEKEIFNTFYSVIESSATPFYKRLAQAGLVATADHKMLILKTWPEIIEQYGPLSSQHKNEL
tara:strand:- start:8 stop:196 length:189 start_codon:yes stop_codon:yes gene_type:complete